MRPFYHQDVRRFHDKFGLTTPAAFTQLPDDLHRFRTGFFNEELNEYEAAGNRADLAEAFDALIDLVYIICGASLLHGIDTDEFYEMIETTECYCYDLFDSDEPPKVKPGFLTLKNHYEFLRMMRKNIGLFEEGHQLNMEAKTRAALTGLYQSVMMCASDMGCTADMWDELWSDVQRANMSKVRAERPSDSKRGSVWDVVKPAGWVAPRTAEIVNKYTA